MQETSPALRQSISDAAKKYRIPGIAAALIEHGQIRAVEVFGMRDEKSGALVTVNTIFEAGSLGEPLYAYAVLRLAADGRINPKQPLPATSASYVRDLDALSLSSATEPLYDPQFNQITAARVMNTSECRTGPQPAFSCCSRLAKNGPTRTRAIFTCSVSWITSPLNLSTNLLRAEF